ncbi:hypothetical protein, partial [Jeotgalibacillus proteolyticus]|uniref:hypothetical protein n=1 Tax=Jeotgalibacillus proteolyticus TaxID=2082395 RepID=UPI003CE93735
KKWLISVALLRPLVSSSPHALKSALRDSSTHVLESLAAEPFLRETLKNDSLDFHLKITKVAITRFVALFV